MSQNLISFACPCCGHHYNDELEVLDPGVIHEFKCEQCQAPFVVYIAVCDPGCGHENVAVSKTPCSVEQLKPATCAACGRTLSEASTINSDDSDLT